MNWEDRIVVAHWPPPEPEPKPKARARPLTGLPAMMHDLMEAADRHDRLKEKP